MDINSLISDYAEKYNVDASEVAARLKNLTSNNMLYETSVFSYGDDASEGELLSYMQKSYGDIEDPDRFASDVGLLFDVLDSNGDGRLSDDELALFERSSGTNSGNVDAFGIWNSLKNIDEATIADNISSSYDNYYKDNYYKNGYYDNSYTQSSSKNRFSDTEYAKSFVNSFIDNNDSNFDTAIEVINWLLNEGLVSDEEAMQLKNAFRNYSDSEEEQISNLMSLGMTEEEAVGYLLRAGKISETDSSLGDGKAITDDTAEELAEKLYNAMKGAGTDESVMEELFNDENLTDADWVKIVNAYSEKYGYSLVSDIDWDYSDGSSYQTKYYNKLVESLTTEAEKGNEEAYEAIANSIYGATAGQTGTADEFLEILFNNIDNESLYEVYKCYNDVTGSDMETDIKNDHKILWWVSSTGKEYLNQITSAIAEYGR